MNDEAMAPGCCGEEFWIADELWWLARKQPAEYNRFVAVCAGMLALNLRDVDAKEAQRIKKRKAKEPK